MGITIGCSSESADALGNLGANWVADRLRDWAGVEGCALARLTANDGLSFIARDAAMDEALCTVLAELSREDGSAFAKRLRSSRLPFSWSVSGEDEHGGSDALPQKITDELADIRFLVFFRRGQPHGDLILISRAPGSPQQPSLETLLSCHGVAQVLFDEIALSALEPPEPPIQITKRERECLTWSAEGKTSEEIGLILSLSTHTVNHYLLSAIKKLNAVNRMHAIAMAFRSGVLKVDRDSGSP